MPFKDRKRWLSYMNHYNDKRRISGKKQQQDKAVYKKTGRRNQISRRLGRKFTQEEYDSFFEWQGGVCALCFKKQERRFDVDHIHGTAIVRGLLCNQCNQMLGLAKDNPELLRAAANYVEV